MRCFNPDKPLKGLSITGAVDRHTHSTLLLRNRGDDTWGRSRSRGRRHSRRTNHFHMTFTTLHLHRTLLILTASQRRIHTHRRRLRTPTPTSIHFTFYGAAAGRSTSASGWFSGSGSSSMVMDGTGVAAHSGIMGSTIGEGGGEGDDGRCGIGGRGDTGAICGSMDDKMGEGGADSRIEGRGRSGFSFEISLTTSSSPNICTSSSRGNLSSNKG